MQGRRDSVTSADGTSIGLLTAGTGPGLLLVHGAWAAWSGGNPSGAC